ncbi:MAG: amino acid racemase [Acidobacteria bacterium]|nr:amino acid racemase [Acidobacteriota bacterium]
MKTVGIVAHSAEGGALCFITACRAGAEALGAHMHPTIVMSCVPMGLSMPAWDADDHEQIATHLLTGIEHVEAAGAEFFMCPDNTAHIVLEQVAERLPIPGLHIAHVAAAEIQRRAWGKVGLLGTEWTMTGPVYPNALAQRGVDVLVPEPGERKAVHDAIFDELCQGTFEPGTTETLIESIRGLQGRGAEAVILGCTELPLVLNDSNSPIPVVDSTRLLACRAVELALDDSSLARGGWLRV